MTFSLPRATATPIAAESPEPIDYRTRDFGATAEWTRKSLLLRGSFHYNDFANRSPFESFDNPFRATDSTDPSAYTGPASGSIGGPAFGRESLAPDNKAVTGSVGFLYKFAKRSRLSADARSSMNALSENGR